MRNTNKKPDQAKLGFYLSISLKQKITKMLRVLSFVIAS